MPTLADNKTCCGCSSCANKCPKGAITMQPDKGGFLQPHVDNTICVECGACEKACPAISTNCETPALSNAYLVQHKDKKIRHQSTSGGAFTAIAQVVLRKGGVVFGASMLDDYTVQHIFVSDVDDLAKFRNSKYVQSIIGDAYKKVKEFLVKGTFVCFSGTPCQIAGLKFFLGKEYNNLLTVDVVCHAIPSPYIFSKYVELTHKRLPNANRLMFRDKERGYSYSTMAWYDNNGKNLYRASYELDEWYRLFLHDKCDRNSCYSCKYQNQPRLSDITIWDCYNMHELYPAWDDNKGTTNLIAWSKRGCEVIDIANEYANILTIDSSLTIGATRHHSRIRPLWDEEQFYNDAHTMPVEDFFAKYVPRNFKARISSALRYFLWLLGLHDVVRHAIQNRRK